MADITYDLIKDTASFNHIPILTLDKRWYLLVPEVSKTDEIKYWEKKVNDLLKKQGQVTNDLKEVKKIKSDVYILGEIWHNSLPWLMGDQFDAVMNYPFADALIKFFCTNEIDEIEFKYRLNDIVSNYQMQTIESGFNLLGSHDTTRVLSYCNNNKDKFKLAYLFMFTQSGAPCIYYGDEVGMTGVQTKDCEGQRECMVWDEDKQDKEILTFMKKIISLRKRYSEFKLVNNEWVLAKDKVIIVKKENISIIINNNDFEKTIDLPDYLKDKKVYDLFNEVYVNLESNLTLNPYKYLIIKN